MAARLLVPHIFLVLHKTVSFTNHLNYFELFELFKCYIIQLFDYFINNLLKNSVT